MEVCRIIEFGFFAPFRTCTVIDPANLRNSQAALVVLPSSLPRSRLRHFAAPFDSADLRNSHATLPVLPPCRPPSAQSTSPQRTAALGSPSVSQSSASFRCAIRLRRPAQLTRNTSRSSNVSSGLGTAHITSENCRPRVPICLAVVCGNSFRHSTPPLGDRGKPYVAPWYTMTSVILVLSCLVSYLPRYCRYRTTSPYSPTVVHLLRRRTTNRAEKFADMKVWFLQ